MANRDDLRGADDLLEIIAGRDDTANTGVALGLAGEPQFRIRLTPQGEILQGDGFSVPAPLELTPAAGSHINVRAHGAVGDGVTDDTAAFTSAVAAADAAGKGLYAPIGTYLLSTNVIFFDTKAVVVGDGKGFTTFKAKSGSTGRMVSIDCPSQTSHVALSGFSVDLSAAQTAVGVYVAGINRSSLQDIFVNYGAYGIQAANFSTSTMERCQTTSQTSAGISINGDGAGEYHLIECFASCNDAAVTMNAGIELVRTNITDTGGIYLTGCRVTKPAGTLTNGFRFVATGGVCEIFAFMSGCVADNTDGPNMLLSDVGNIRIQNSWFLAGSAGSAIRTEGNVSILQFIGNTLSKTAGNFEFTGNPTQIVCIGNRVGSGDAFVFGVGSQPTHMHLAANIIPGTLTNNRDVLARAASVSPLTAGLEVLTHSSAGSARTLVLSNENSNKKHLRLNSGGTFEIVNEAYSKVILGLSDTGIVVTTNVVAPASTPAGGGYLYSENGALKYKGSAGTVTTIALA